MRRRLRRGLRVRQGRGSQGKAASTGVRRPRRLRQSSPTVLQSQCRTRSLRRRAHGRWSCCTAAQTTLANSGMVSEKNSPVPPAAKRPAGPCCRSHSICSRYGLSSKAKSRVKWVTGNDSRPPPILFASSSGAILSIAVLYLQIRGAKTQFTVQDSITSGQRSTPLPDAGAIGCHSTNVSGPARSLSSMLE